MGSRRPATVLFLAVATSAMAASSACAPLVLDVGRAPEDAAPPDGGDAAAACAVACAGGRRCVAGECLPHWVPVHAPEVPRGTSYGRARTGHFVVWTGREVIVWGGHDPTAADAGAYGDGLRIDTRTSEVRELPSEGMPEPRYNDGQETAVWTGTEMIVLGGRASGGRELVDGAAYHPDENRWTRLPVPTEDLGPRAGFSTVFTGTEVVVWGGARAGAATAIGARLALRPSGLAWSPTQGDGGAGSRRHHTAVWTGAEMLAWGGEDDGLALPRHGWRFAPRSDAWRAIAGAAPEHGRCTGASGNAPAGRVDHTAVWVGTEMLVFGGRDGDRALGADVACERAAAYAPAADRWRRVSLDGAPSARYGHVAVWTGRAMLVWGGTADGVRNLADGAAFDPARDRWSPLADAVAPAAPDARRGARAVWTGAELVVVGGAVDGADAARAPVAWRYQP